MARARVSRFRAGSSRKRTSVWVAPADQNYISVATGASVIFSTFDAEASGALAPTVIRTRGMVSVRFSSAADLTVSGAYGECIVSNDAVAAGQASVPHPFDDADWSGWHVWRSFCYFFDQIDQTGANVWSQQFEVDFKAMRKMRPNETLIGVIESQSGAFDLCAHTRTLLKLS